MRSNWSGQSQVARNVLTATVCLSLLAIGTCGCSSTGRDYESQIEVPKTVRHVESLDSRLTPYYHLFVSTLESNGFEVGRTDDPRALQLKVELVRNPSALEIAASLWQEETALVNVRAGGIVLAGSAHT